MLPLTPSQRLSQNKISGQAIAWGRAQWQKLEDGSEGYAFPKGALQLAQSLDHLEQQLHLTLDDLVDCIEQFEDQLGDPQETRSKLGLLKDFGEISPGLVTRSRKDDRVVCVMTPASWEVDKVEAYFQWYLDDMSANMLARFDDLAGVNLASPALPTPDVPSYDEACSKLHGKALTEARRNAFLQGVWDYHKNLAAGYREGTKKQLIREWQELTQDGLDESSIHPFPHSKTEWGVRWSEFDKNDRKVTKEKMFSSKQARDKFADGIEKKDNFAAFEAWSDPPTNESKKKRL